MLILIKRLINLGLHYLLNLVCPDSPNTAVQTFLFFRWKGENVSTTEVSNTLTDLDFIHDANVYGVLVPGKKNPKNIAILMCLLVVFSHKRDGWFLYIRNIQVSKVNT